MYDKSEMVLTVTLEKLDEDDEDLDVSGLTWDEYNGIAHWTIRSWLRTTKCGCAVMAIIPRPRMMGLGPSIR